MSRPDDLEVKALSTYDEADVEALAAHFLAEAEAIEAEALAEAEAEAQAAELEAKTMEEAAALEAEADAPVAEDLFLTGGAPLTAEGTSAAEAAGPDETAKAGKASDRGATAPAEDRLSTEGEALSTAEGVSVSKAAGAAAGPAVTAAAPVQAPISDPEKEKIFVSDTGDVPEADFLPFTLSVADSDGLAVPVLEKGVKLPAAVKMNFSAPYKTPSAVKFRLYMGESIFAKDNILIDYIKLPGIREYRGGITRIVMTLHMERNGDIEIELLDEGSVSRRHDRIELHLAECVEALKGKTAELTAEDAELRDSYRVIQRARFIAASAARLLKAGKKEIEKDKAAGIRAKIKELKAAAKTAPSAVTPAQKGSMKKLINEISAMF